METHPDERGGPLNGSRPPNGEPESATSRDDRQAPVRDKEIFSLDSSFSIDEFFSEETGAPAPPETAPVIPLPARPVEVAVASTTTPPTKPASTRIPDEPLAPVEISRADLQENGAAWRPAENLPTAAGLPAIDAPEPIGPAMSLAELLENTGPVDWQEAVAIAQRICRAVSRHPTAGAHEYLLDTRHVEITERGEVHILPGAPGGDPLVKQVGRILRTLLEGGTAPLQLRLVASQAAFELPGFSSLEELSETLRNFERTPESDAIRMAFLRGREAKFTARVDHDSAPRVDAVALKPLIAPPIAPREPAWTDFAKKTATTANNYHAPLAALAVVFVAALAYLSVSWMGVAGQPQAAPTTLVEVTSPPTTEQVEVVEPPTVAAPISAPEVARSTLPTQRSRAANVAPSAPSEPPAFTRAPDSGGLTLAQIPIERNDVPEFSEEQTVFDSIVLANPLYQLDSARSTPEAVAMLRNSKRSFLQSIARRDYDKAREFLEAGDSERAVIEANRVMRMLDDRDIGPLPAGLRDSVEQFLARATAAKAHEDERVYSVADKSVIPPAAIGRQLPVTPPIGLSQGLVGTLEMIISQQGEVEVVRLHTPLNRYHERMIVSAAKAWRYRPAVKNGKPVKYRLISSINLPES